MVKISDFRRITHAQHARITNHFNRYFYRFNARRKWAHEAMGDTKGYACNGVDDVDCMDKRVDEIGQIVGVFGRTFDSV